MFTTKPEAGENITKLGGGVGEAKTPFTERPATYASKSPGPNASKMVPSIIGEDLTIRGNVTSKGEIQVDGEIEGDIRCGSLLLGDKSKVTGGVAAEDVVVRGHIVGSVRGLRITLQAQSHVEGDIFHQSLAIEQGQKSNAINRYVGTLTDLYPSGACRFACDEVMEAVRTSTRSLRPPFSFQRRKDGTAQRVSRRAAPVLSHAAKEAARSIWRPLLRCGLVVGRAESPDRERGDVAAKHHDSRAYAAGDASGC